jgi:AcrR family transcriptional regulator
VIRIVKTYLSIDNGSTVSETAERLMDLAEAHIRNAGYGHFSFCDLAAEIGIKSTSVHHHFPTKATMAAAVARRYGDRFLAAVARRPNESAGDAISVYRLAFREALSRPGLTSGIGTLLNFLLLAERSGFWGSAAADRRTPGSWLRRGQPRP